MDGLNDGIVISSYKLQDMIFSEMKEDLPEGFEFLLLAPRNLLEEYVGNNVMSLSMPLQVHELIDTVDMMVQGIERRRRKRRALPKERDPKEEALIGEAKALLMERNNMTEEEAHRYIQKCSTDSSTNMVETAQMVLSIMRD